MTLDIRQNEKYQKAESRIERLGWVVLTLFIIAGLLGLVGSGPLSSSTATSDNGLVSVDYDRVIHHEADTLVTLRFSGAAVEDGAITAVISGSWVSGIDLQGISPETSEQRTVPNGVTLEWTVDESGETEAVLSFRAQEYGPLNLDVSVGTDSVHLSQFVLP